MTSAHVPIESMYARRACASYAAGRQASSVGGQSGNGVGQPASAKNPTVEIWRPSITQMSRPESSRTIAGTRSRYFAGTREVQTSADSRMWVSASRWVYLVAVAVAGVVVVA